MTEMSGLLMQKKLPAFLLSVYCLLASCFNELAFSQTPAGSPGMLEQQLVREDPAALAAEASKLGDARRGAILFYQPYLAWVAS